MKHLKINSRLLKLDKVYLIYVLALAFSSPLFAQSAQYYVLVNKSKLASGCTVDTDFTTFTLSTKMKSEQRNKIIEVYEKRLNPSEDRSIRKFELYIFMIILVLKLGSINLFLTKLQRSPPLLKNLPLPIPMMIRPFTIQKLCLPRI